MDFEVLILGSDINAYYMARCTHEAYNKKAYLLANRKMAFTAYSTILNIIYNPKIWEEEAFLEALEEFSKEHKGKKVLLVSSNETYARFIVKNKDVISKQYVYNYPSLNILDTLVDKELFYKSYSNSIIELPRTLYYDCSKKTTVGSIIDDKVQFPIILKPADVISYGHLDFAGKNKIYKIYSKSELESKIDIIKEAGYKKAMIIQEYIPGDDSYLFDSVVYCNQKGEVKLISFAQIGLQEHTKHMVGNAAVLINGFNSFNGNVDGMVKSIKDFMESIKYHGFAEFDLKYDSRDNKFKVLEINARQGRSSYYLEALGYNLIKVLVDDLLLKKNMEYSFLSEQVLLSFVPKRIIKKYVKNSCFKAQALKLWKLKGAVRPLMYKKEKNLKRYIIYLKRQFDYYNEYKNGYWDND